MREIPARIHATGCVFETDEGNDSFVVKVWQHIFGVLFLSPLTIRAIMRLPDSFLRAYQPLPPVESTITFTGDLLTVENGIAFVAVHDHSYFFENEFDEFEQLDNLCT